MVAHNEVVVRRAAYGDAEAIAAVRIASWQEGYRGIAPQEKLDSMDVAASTKQWRGWLAQAHALPKKVFVGVVAGQVLGVSSYGPADSDCQGSCGVRCAQLNLMYVHPQAWSGGVGSAMLGTCMADMVRCGFIWGYLWVARDSVRSRGFYQKHGWSPTGEVDEDRSIPVVKYEVAPPTI